MFREINSLEKRNKITNDTNDNKKQLSDNMKDMLLSEISSKACFDEVYRNQIKIIEEKEKEHKQKKQEEYNQK